MRIRKSYLAALVNPFDAPTVGVPHEPALSSMKVKQFARGTFSVQSTNGFGFISMKPQLGNNSGTINTSQTGGTGTTVTDVVGPTTSVLVNMNGPYSVADLNSNSVMGRIVGMGIRIRYIGPELYRGGLALSLEEPGHQSLVGYDTDAIARFDRARFHPVTRDWIPVTWQPVVPEEYSYTDGTALVYGGHACLAIVVNTPSTIPVSAVFEFEATMIYEAIGYFVRAKTPTPLDSKQTLLAGLATGVTSETTNYALTAVNTFTAIFAPLAYTYYNQSLGRGRLVMGH